MKNRIIGIIIVLVSLFSFDFLYANEENIVVNNFFKFIEYINDNNDEVLYLIDNNNDTLFRDVKRYMSKSNFGYDNKISVMKNDNDDYVLAVLMNGNGKVFSSDWSIKNKYIYFTYSYDEEKDIYILKETDLFESSGIRVLENAYSKLFKKALIVSFIVFIVVLIIIVIITRFTIKKEINKYKKEYKVLNY